MGGMASHEQPKGLARPAASQPAMKKEPESVRSGTSQQYSSLDVGLLRTIQREQSPASQQQSRRPRKIVNLPTPHIASLLAFFPSSFQHFFGIFHHSFISLDSCWWMGTFASTSAAAVLAFPLLLVLCSLVLQNVMKRMAGSDLPSSPHFHHSLVFCF